MEISKLKERIERVKSNMEVGLRRQRSTFKSYKNKIFE